MLVCDGDSEDPEARDRVAGALVAKGVVRAEVQQSGLALACLDEAVARFGGDDDPRLRLHTCQALAYKGWMLGQLDRYCEAEAVFAEILERVTDASDLALRESAARALYSKGHMLRRVGRREDALDALDGVRRFADDTTAASQRVVAKAMRLRVSILGDLGRPEAAIRCADEIVGRYGAETAPDLREHVAAALAQQVHIGAANGLR